jgi:hypothetical protein
LEQTEQTKDPKNLNFSAGDCNTVTQAATQGALLGVQKPQSPTSPIKKKMFESSKETLQAFHNKNNVISGKE